MNLKYKREYVVYEMNNDTENYRWQRLENSIRLNSDSAIGTIRAIEHGLQQEAYLMALVSASGSGISSAIVTSSKLPSLYHREKEYHIMLMTLLFGRH